MDTGEDDEYLKDTLGSLERLTFEIQKQTCTIEGIVALLPQIAHQLNRIETDLNLLLERTNPYRNSIYCPPISLESGSGTTSETGSGSQP